MDSGKGKQNALRRCTGKGDVQVKEQRRLRLGENVIVGRGENGEE